MAAYVVLIGVFPKNLADVDIRQGMPDKHADWGPEGAGPDATRTAAIGDKRTGVYLVPGVDDSNTGAQIQAKINGDPKAQHFISKCEKFWWEALRP